MIEEEAGDEVKLILPEFGGVLIPEEEEEEEDAADSVEERKCG